MLLAHPLTKGLDLDDPRTTRLRRQIIQEKKFLRGIYQEWYKELVSRLTKNEKPVLELGSGAGFLTKYIANLITSDVAVSLWLSVVVDGQRVPFDDESLHAMAMINVFHHIPRVVDFLDEATQCIEPGGLLLMIEPWVTRWSTWIYRKFHHEPFSPDAEQWEFPLSGPLSGANMALPWIVFERDREIFETNFPAWEIEVHNLSLPFRYLLSGGVSMPGFTYGLWRRLERWINPWMHYWAMFALIVLMKRYGTDN